MGTAAPDDQRLAGDAQDRGDLEGRSSIRPAAEVRLSAVGRRLYVDFPPFSRSPAYGGGNLPPVSQYLL